MSSLFVVRRDQSRHFDAPFDTNCAERGFQELRGMRELASAREKVGTIVNSIRSVMSYACRFVPQSVK
jgi:hypothetical protein